MSYTKGPWIIGRRAADYTAGQSIDAQILSLESTAVHNTDGSVASVYAPSGELIEREANARLIAAAPALLETAQQVIGAFRHEGDYAADKAISVLAVAVEQATGGIP